MSSSNSSSVSGAFSNTHSVEEVRIRGTVIFTWSLMLINVALRFVARRLSKAPLWYDDWLIIPATLSATACFAAAIWLTQQGLGRRPYVSSPDQFVMFFMGMLISEHGWAIAICIIKCSILAFYWRIFSSTGRSFKIAVWALLALTINWGIAVEVATILQCSFNHRNWSEGRCLNHTYLFFVGSSVPHIITDIALIALPMPLIWRLQMRQSQKTVLSFILGLGGFVTIVAFVRLGYLIKADVGPANATTNMSNILIWTGVEVNVSLVCACLPSLRPIATFISERFCQPRKRKLMHQRRSGLLMNRLKPGNATPVLPLSRKKSWDDGLRLILDSSSAMEMEAKVPGRSVSELDKVEPTFEI